MARRQQSSAGPMRRRQKEITVAFENVDMGPVERAFSAWKKADALAQEGESALAYIASLNKGSAVRPILTVDARLKAPGSDSEFGRRSDWEAVGRLMSGVLMDDALANVQSCVLAARANADRLRESFLRLTMVSCIPGLSPSEVSEVASNAL